ncbi:hypothetical protein JMK10_21265 [Rhodovulum sulfidophilum]|uniref:hypothetical protein n=1 Tax=Rhodovulum sulfidophilum TaxID=35806 RepID=UPI001923D631|nr:hypothetical protein [Rhodovulum sulfidophilum]MBL3576352.1 hypothetical protein [Rhodovulum sulfidophilum]MCE8418394.1 hypothetical protein [Rhodovulum sulfidophilum]MCE8433751.1 hypothetical protein [Rhodovulum sulfidophilum]MCE8438684.1 hypothetical protein [Rhodovulum sulfidophilum]MCE8467979.1 hypothetical protein [Rhodovulum sulfidophilum]
MTDTVRLLVKSDGLDLGVYDQDGRRIEGVLDLAVEREHEGLTFITMTVIAGKPRGAQIIGGIAPPPSEK